MSEDEIKKPELVDFGLDEEIVKKLKSIRSELDNEYFIPMFLFDLYCIILLQIDSKYLIFSDFFSYILILGFFITFFTSLIQSTILYKKTRKNYFDFQLKKNKLTMSEFDVLVQNHSNYLAELKKARAQIEASKILQEKLDKKKKIEDIRRKWKIQQEIEDAIILKKELEEQNLIDESNAKEALLKEIKQARILKEKLEEKKILDTLSSEMYNLIDNAKWKKDYNIINKIKDEYDILLKKFKGVFLASEFKDYGPSYSRSFYWKKLDYFDSKSQWLLEKLVNNNIPLLTKAVKSPNGKTIVVENKEEMTPDNLFDSKSNQDNKPIYQSNNRTSFRSAQSYINKSNENKRIGLAGEIYILNYEKNYLSSIGRNDLAEKVVHVAVSENNGLGYDILSFDNVGNPKHIEVKTTTENLNSSFFLTINEYQKLLKMENYFIFRVYNFNSETLNGNIYIINGKNDLSQYFSINPSKYRLRKRTPTNALD